MRDAFGSTFMFKLIIIFIVFYVSFMTIAVSYAKVFRVKNGVIDILEQYQYDSNGSNAQNIIDKVDNYLSKFHYNEGANGNVEKLCKEDSGNQNASDEKYENQFTENGACIIRTGLGEGSVFYEVVVYLVVSFPLFNQDFVIPIRGETTTIHV